jgi:hypothetical protein
MVFTKELVLSERALAPGQCALTKYELLRKWDRYLYEEARIWCCPTQAIPPNKC